MQVESLESRRMFAVTAPTLVGGELRVFGDTTADVIRVRQADAATVRVEVNGQVFQFVDANVTSLRLNVSPTNLTAGTAGNDLVEVVSTAALPLSEPARIFGGAGNDTLTGGDGGDVLMGEGENDTLNGGKGSDALDAGTGSNTLSGGADNDTLTAGTGKDTFDGGVGFDSVSYATRTANLNISLDNIANDGQSSIFGVGGFGSVIGTARIINPLGEADNVRDSVENVTTGSGNDVITAGANVVANLFSGGAGNDKLDGRAGDDVLNGGDGNDTLTGRDGKDTLNGGNNDDVLSGGSNDDALNGGAGNDILTGGLGRDALRGEAGNDFLFAQDGFVDAVLDGGADFDFLERDANDPAGSLVEAIL